MTRPRCARIAATMAALPFVLLARQAAAGPEAGDLTLRNEPSTDAAPTRIGRLNDNDWTLRIEPAVWLVSPSGKLRMPGAADDLVRIETLNLDSPRPRPSGEIHLAAEPFRFSFFASQFGLDRDFVSEEAFDLGDVSIMPGDVVDVDFEFTMIELSAGYCVYQRGFDDLSLSASRAVDADLRVYALAGLRLYDLDIGVEEPGVAASGVDRFFGEPILGGRAELEIAGDFSIDAQVSGGGYFDTDQSVASIDVVVGFRWRPHPNVGVQIGWRQLAYFLEDGDGEDTFEYDGRMAGIQAGVVIRF